MKEYWLDMDFEDVKRARISDPKFNYKEWKRRRAEFMKLAREKEKKKAMVERLEGLRKKYNKK